MVAQDYAPYPPSYGEPAAFIASPIFDDEELLGALVFQMPRGKLNRIASSVDDEPAFVEAATYESIQQHASVAFIGFAHTEDAAWIFYRGEGVVYPLSAGNICALETQPRSAGQRPDRPLYSRHSSRQVCPPG